jgi:hypothetical protein
MYPSPAGTLAARTARAIAGPLLIASLPYRAALSVIAGTLVLASGLPLIFDAFVQRTNATYAEPLQLPRRNQTRA